MASPSTRGRRSPKSDGSTPSKKRHNATMQDEGSFVDRSNNCFTARESDGQELPGINERLGHLRPSRELLEYYRKKIAEYDDEHDELVSKLEEYKVTYEEQHRLQWELRQREEEIVELQKALSDMQIYLFQEREHVLRLYAENDRLKIRELEDKKKIQKLLNLGSASGGEVTYFLKEPPARAIVQQHKGAKNAASKTRSTSAGSKKKSIPIADRRRSMEMLPEEKYQHDNEVLTLQVESLQAQLSEQTKLAKEQLDALLEDRRVKEEEFETRRIRDEEKIRILTEKLHKTQDLLYDSTKDFLEQRYQSRADERVWMGEKDKIMQQLDRAKSQVNSNARSQRSNLNVSVGSHDGRTVSAEELKSLEYQLTQSQKMADMYREQVIQLEDELSRIREEGDVTREVFQDRSHKMTKRLELMNVRYQDLERRRALEVEGFQTDIKNLRQRLKDVERQLYKVTLGFTEDMDVKRPDDLDMQILRNVRSTAGRSKKIMGELKNLKSKVYGLENDLKHL
ncbi:coiled-coil domain-containing protein 77-like [Littorina saxatilis]|uniref:Coiled-coil domain-containing protein 77 n=1 Tax=Littorina saxatilis TaxID=31220 RepID=A0AAN9GBB0_9CAEN